MTYNDDDHMEIDNIGLVPTSYGFYNTETGEHLDHEGKVIEHDED